MKKVLLSSFLFVIFTAYTLYARIIGANAPIVLTPDPNKTKIVSNRVPPPVLNTGKYRDGNYNGSVADAYYGNVQVMAIISGGEIIDVQFLNYPQDRQTSVQVNTRAMPYLVSEAIVLQDANVDTVSGASFTSTAFRESLSSALLQARI